MAIAVGLIVYGINSMRRPPPPPPASDGRPVAAAPREDLVPVVVALKNIGRGAKITAEQVTTLRVQGPAPVGSLSEPKLAVDAIALTALPAGQILLQSTILAPGDDAKPGLSVLVPEGMRAVAIRVNDEVAVGNFLRADDIVDIQLVLANNALGPPEEGGNPERRESRVVLQALKVLSVGEALTIENDQQAVRMQNITVAVTPEQALVLAVAKQSGSFYLALRNPADEEKDEVKPVRLEDLLGAARQQPVSDSGEALPAPAVVAPRQVEVILGTNTGKQAVP
ncbi:Flp pilus assembly protein CpaB [Zavarzinia compransoris]|uniref:Flp pilus assembly protein CpaB n=1 Tax=Zavarzinia marina TaxID=2911065 RepID=UPI001F4682D1|nr:Flp pilus assembly protein CpaB [Zavarzinia marina]MCF4166117.1 Flp pilus assembly protein CpaB [Zavarzinia marina]